MPAPDDRPVFLVQLGRERVKIVFVGLVVLVDADARRRRRRQEHVMIRHAGGLGRGFDVVDVDLQMLLAAIFDRPDADHRRDRHDRAAHHRLLEILRVVFRKGRDLLLEQQQLLVGPRLEAFEPLLDVGEEAGLREFAVGDDVDAAFDLLAHAVGDRLGDGRVDIPSRHRAGRRTSPSSCRAAACGRGRLPICVVWMRSVFC